MRLTLREYIDDPSLLDGVSMSELQTWADEVPYAGLIKRLMVIKAQRDTSGKMDNKDVFRQALIYNSNPHAALSPLPPKEVVEETSEVVPSEEITSSPQVMEELTDKDEVVDIVDESMVSEAAIVATMGAGAISIATADDEMEVELESDDVEESIDAVANTITTSHDETVSEMTDNNDIEETNDNEDVSGITIEELIDDSAKKEDNDTEEEGELEGFSSWLQGLKKIDAQEETDANITLKANVASEALAQLLAEQGYIGKATAMYEQLILKYPEKSSFFAAEIEKLKTS